MFFFLNVLTVGRSYQQKVQTEKRKKQNNVFKIFVHSCQIIHNFVKFNDFSEIVKLIYHKQPYDANSRVVL